MSSIKGIISSLFPYSEYEHGVSQIQGISENTRAMLSGCYQNLCELACDDTNPNQIDALKEVANQFNLVKLENANAKIALLSQQLENSNAEIAIMTQQLENANAEIAIMTEQFGY